MKLISAAILSVAFIASAHAKGPYSDAYPYHKTAEQHGVSGYNLYPLHGCTDYEMKDLRIKHICNQRNAREIFRTLDKEGQGTTQ